MIALDASRAARQHQHLSLDCSGDEYLGIDGVNLDRVTLFDIDIGWIELSIFYHDRSTEG